MAHILRALPNVCLIGYKETGLSIMHLHMQLTRSNIHLKDDLKLKHVDNVGKYFYEEHLQFGKKLSMPYINFVHAWVMLKYVRRIRMFHGSNISSFLLHCNYSII